MTEKLNITFLDGLKYTDFDVLGNPIFTGRIMVNGLGPFYYATGTKVVKIDDSFVCQVRKLIKNKRGKK